MPEKKKDKATLQIIFSSILLAVILFVELYAMINVPDQFIIIGIVGILFIACLYVLVQGIIRRLDMRKQDEKERYDNIFKSQKASYLLMKKYFGEIEEKLDLLERTSKVPTDEIVGMQKGIGKVIISRSRENAEAIMSSNEVLGDRIEKFEEKIQENKDSVIASYKSIGEENVNQLLMKQQDIIMSLKDMELRLNTAIMQSQKVVAAAPQIVTAPMQAPAAVQTPVDPVAQQITETVAPEFSVPEPEIIPEPAEEPAPAPEPEVVAEPIAEEKPPMPDLSDPNKVMSPDDIAALLANMGADDTPAEEPAPAPEPEVVPEPIAEEKPPMPDLSDPNKVMSPDDIAALLANMGVDDTPAEEPAPAPEPAAAAPEIDLSDPNKKLSEDDIAALFASMGN